MIAFHAQPRADGTQAQPSSRAVQFSEVVDPILGGSWVVISRVTSRAKILITQTRGLVTLLITTPEPPNRMGASFQEEL